MTSFAMCNKFKQCITTLIDKENSFAIWNKNKNIVITIDNSCLEDVSTNEKALESWNKLIKKWEAEGTALKLIYCRENPKDIEITSVRYNTSTRKTRQAKNIQKHNKHNNR